MNGNIWTVNELPQCGGENRMWFVLLLVSAYLVGSVPTSIMLGKVLRGIDVREHGSRNPGATNTFRVLGWKIGTLVGAIDIFKGYAAAALLPAAFPENSLAPGELLPIMAGFAAIAGHVWTVFANFRGGKGVGTAFGVFIGLAPIPSLIVLIVWVTLTFATGYVSVGSIAAAAALPLSVVFLGLGRGDISIPLSVLSTVVGVLVIIRHRSNIGRLLRGEENRFGKRGKK
jgi:glycerol-3-phosphate acyltransferase PlsY